MSLHATHTDHTDHTAHPEAVSSLLSKSHAHLESLYERLLAAMAVDAPDVATLWSELDHQLFAHMEAEERYVLPKFARVDLHEARSLLHDHARIREQLLELGVAVDLHVLRYERSKEFIDRLRAHAAREDRLLYRWADVKLGEETASLVKKYLHR